jgi:hypothetical protein
MVQRKLYSVSDFKIEDKNNQAMKRQAFIPAVIIFVVGSAFVAAGGISGKWTGTLTLPGGNTRIFHYVFHADKGILTGSATGTNTFDLSNGRIYGDSLAFSIIVSNGDSIVNTGKYYPDGDSITLNTVFMGATMRGILKRDSDGAAK